MEQKFEITGVAHECHDQELMSGFVELKKAFASVLGLTISVACDYDGIVCEAKYKGQSVARNFLPETFSENDSGIKNGFAAFRSDIERLIMVAGQIGGAKAKPSFARRAGL